MNIASKMKEIRNDLCFSKAEFARLLEVDRSCVTLWENGTRIPSYEILRRLKKAAKSKGINVDTKDIRND